MKIEKTDALNVESVFLQLLLVSLQFQNCIKSFLDAILGDKCDELIIDLPKKTLPGFYRNAVLITENELHALVGYA